MTVVVLGSINADLVLNTARLPATGETVRATKMQTFPGGKGANQAVATARMGAPVVLVGRIGDDGSGRTVRAAIADAGVDVSPVHIDPDAPTGTAFITVADNGDNTIVTVGGANHLVGTLELDAFKAAVSDARLVLVQLEIPMDVVEAAVALASEAGVPVLLDPAPVADVPHRVLSRLAWVTPNEHEAVALTGKSEPMDAARELRDRGVTHAVVTLGPRGCAYAGPDGELQIGAPQVDAVDTVACGDAFNGALASALHDGTDVAGALRIACAAGAAAATNAGAYASLPTAAEVGRLLPGSRSG
jgi:ribokinase